MPEHDSYGAEGRCEARLIAVPLAMVLVILILMALLEGSALDYLRAVVSFMAILGFMGLCEDDDFLTVLCFGVYVVQMVHVALPPVPRRIFVLSLIVTDTAATVYLLWRGYLELSVRAAWPRYREWRTGGFEHVPLNDGLHLTSMNASMNASTDTVTDMPPPYNKADEEDSVSEPPGYSLDDEARIGG